MTYRAVHDVGSVAEGQGGDRARHFRIADVVESSAAGVDAVLPASAR